MFTQRSIQNASKSRIKGGRPLLHDNVRAALEFQATSFAEDVISGMDEMHGTLNVRVNYRPDAPPRIAGVVHVTGAMQEIERHGIASAKLAA